VTASNLYPPSDNSGVVGSAALTWNNGQFTNLTVDSTLSVRAAIDLADSDVLRWGTSDDVTSAYNGTSNILLFNIVTASGGIDFAYQGSNVLELDSTGANVVGAFTVNGVPITGGATGAGGDEIFWENDTVVTTSYTITSGKNAMTAGPITVNGGVTVTVPSGSTWTVV
jgi:hypothetical protein